MSSDLRVTESTVTLPRWLASLIVLGVISVATAHVEARFRLSSAETRIQKLEQRDEKFAQELKQELQGLRTALGVMQLDVNTICMAVSKGDASQCNTTGVKP